MGEIAKSLFFRIRQHLLILLAAVGLAGAGSFFFAILLSALDSRPFAFAITLQSSETGLAQLFYDVGRGISELDSVHVSIQEENDSREYRFRLPYGRYRALRFDPLNHAGRLAFSGAKIIDRNGTTVRNFSSSQFLAVQQIQALQAEGEVVTVDTTVGANDPILQITVDAPFSLGSAWHRLSSQSPRLVFMILFLVSWGGVGLAEQMYVRRQIRVALAWRRLWAWAGGHPQALIGGVAFVAVLINCYPVVFFGKSFVSPNFVNGPTLLYDHYPTLPGYDAEEAENPKGSDVGAMMWAHLPYSIIESRALTRDFEFPLWNRYNSGGVTLFGQGQSMFGDPLHCLVLLAGGTSWAWDLKYLIAKLLFAAGLGLTVYAASRSFPVALLLTFSSVFIGFFSYRFNHPAFFSMCYAPWILYCWLKITHVPTTSLSALWLGGLILANWAEMNSGTVKEAYLLLLSLNWSGMLVFLFSRGARGPKYKKALQLLWAGGLFVLISIPVWLTFRQALRQSYTASDVPYAWQIQPAYFIGLFDELFYRQLNDGEHLFNPSANFFILLGVLWSLARLKDLLANRIYLAVGVGALLPLALAFGVIPPHVIVKIPFLANVGHLDDTFSSALIIHSVVLAGFGLTFCWEGLSTPDWPKDFVVVLLLMLALLALYFGATQAAQRTSVVFLRLGQEIPKSVFFYIYVLSLVSAMIALPLLLRHMSLRRAATPSALVLVFIGFGLMHWRHGMHLSTAVDNYVMNPQARVNLQAVSPVLNFMKTSTDQPFRAAGFGGNLSPGYTAVFDVEGLNGPDALINPYYREVLLSFPLNIPWGWRVFVDKETLPQRKRAYDFLNVKYYLASHREAPKTIPELRLVGRFDLDIYASDTTWPRAFFTDTLSVYETPQEFVALLKAGDGKPFGAIQRTELARHPLLEKFVAAPTDRQVIPAMEYQLTTNTTSFTVRASSPGIIILAEAYQAEDFYVTVNGQTVPCFRANHAFKGVWVDAPGRYTVTFSYWPQHLTLSLLGSGAGVIILMTWLSVSWRAYRKEQGQMSGKNTIPLDAGRLATRVA